MYKLPFDNGFIFMYNQLISRQLFQRNSEWENIISENFHYKFDRSELYKIWIDREKARRDKRGMKRKGFFLSTIRISLSNSTIIYLLQPIRSAYKNMEIVREAQKLKDEKDEEEVSSLLLHWGYWYPIIIMILLWHLFSTNKLFLDCNVNLGTGTQKIILLILKLRTLLL